MNINASVSYWKWIGSGGPWVFGRIYVWGLYEMRGGTGWQQVTEKEYKESLT